MINEEYSEMIVAILSCSGESSVVLSEVNDVVNPDFINLDRAHVAPPFSGTPNLLKLRLSPSGDTLPIGRLGVPNFVVKAATRGVNPWRRAPAPPFTIAVTEVPATEGSVASWVKFNVV